MINWQTPDLFFSKQFMNAQAQRKGMGSDSSAANIYLLRKKYDTLIACHNGALLRYYRGDRHNRTGYGFPLLTRESDIGGLLEEIVLDSRERGAAPRFCLCDERQKSVIDRYLPVEWKTFDGDCDYIYKRESLATLSGKKLHRKRNHINNFRKLYDECTYVPASPDNADDIIFVAKKWLEEREDTIGDSELSEFESIKEAAAGMRELDLFGGILYVGDVPAAMTLASAVSDTCIDVHYEKAIGEYALNGAFTVINQCFAASDAAAGYEYINREEDMGIPGLRTAKESYYPAYKLKKYYGVFKC